MTQIDAQNITQYLDIQSDLPEHAELAFIFGTRWPKPAHIAADLIERQVVDYVVITGGANRLTGANEANTHLNILLRANIPRDCLILEDISTNTLENVTFARKKIAQYVQIESVRAIIILTKWYHTRRAAMTLKRHFPIGINYYAIGYEPEGITRRNWQEDEVGRNRVLKEWRNIPKYLAQDDIAEVRNMGSAYI